MREISMTPYQVHLWSKTLRASVGLDLFVKDRLSFASHAIGIEDDDDAMSVILIAERGAQDAVIPSMLGVSLPYQHQPTIVAVYTRWFARRKGYGMKALRAGIMYCRIQGYSKVRITATAQIARLIARLPQEDQDYLTVSYYDPIFDRLEPGS